MLLAVLDGAGSCHAQRRSRRLAATSTRPSARAARSLPTSAERNSLGSRRASGRKGGRRHSLRPGPIGRLRPRSLHGAWRPRRNLRQGRQGDDRLRRRVRRRARRRDPGGRKDRRGRAWNSRQGRPLDFALARYNRDGTLDRTFGDGGKVLTTFEPNSIDGASAVLIQSDGKIVAAGSTRSGATREFAVARYLPNGRSTELRRGRPRGDADPVGTVFDLAVQPDGKLIAAGWSNPGGFDIALARYNPDGSLDSASTETGSSSPPRSARPAPTQTTCSSCVTGRSSPEVPGS